MAVGCRLHRVDQRQVEGEGAALARRALEPDLAAEQAGDLAADRQAQAGAAVLAAGAVSACWNASKMTPACPWGCRCRCRDHGEGDHRVGAVEQLVLRAPAAGGELGLERDAAPLGELEGVGEQVLEHLLQPLGVGLERRRQARVELDVEVAGPCVSATWRKVRSTNSRSSPKRHRRRRPPPSCRTRSWTGRGCR